MSQENLSRIVHKVAHLLPVILFSVALYIVHKQINAHELRDITATLKATPITILMLATFVTVINYWVLAAYDWLALRYTGHNKIPLFKMMATALLSYAISNNTGHAWAAGGSIRYRFYSKWGVPGWDILKISFFQAITYLLGALTLGLVGSLVLPYYLPSKIPVPDALHYVSLICTVFLLAYWLVVLLWRKPLLIRGIEFNFPAPLIAFWQTLVASLDVILSSLVLWVLLLGKVHIDFSAFMVVFVVAQVVGVMSQVPGGIGVFEGVFLLLMHDVAAKDQHLILIGALLLYRVIYYFLPLLLAGISLFAYEVYSRRKILSTGAGALQKILSAIVPQLYSFLLLLAGALLLVSGALPTSPEVVESIRDIVPLPVLELSHLTGSLVGVLLLLLARGIWLKIDVAWYGSIGLLGLGILTSLLKGFDWHEAIVLSIILLMMVPTKAHFQRQSSLLHLPYSMSWLASVAMVLVGCVWLGFFSYRDVQFSQDLWWQFSYEGNAPRFQRAFLMIIIVIVAYALSYLLSVAPPKYRLKPTATDLMMAKEIIMNSSDTQGYLALLGDKYLFWNEAHDAFIMYAITSQFWIAMGNPVGNKAAIEELLYGFLEHADQYGAKAVFYQTSEAWLPAYLELGLSLFKLGEEALVDLTNFSLQGKQRENQRSAINKFTKLGFSFEILSGAVVENVLPQLRQISDAWLSHKSTREKGFSLGFFEEGYIKNCDVAVIKDEAGNIKAFANLWLTSDKAQLSVDLMRYQPNTPNGIMDYLFAELMLWGRAENYQWFCLGMAPLAGLNNRPLSPLWNKVGATLFKKGEHFYNFEGLYEYKAKYAPQWHPRYLAAPAGLSVPFILMQIARIISGGWQGIFGK